MHVRVSLALLEHSLPALRPGIWKEFPMESAKLPSFGGYSLETLPYLTYEIAIAPPLASIPCPKTPLVRERFPITPLNASSLPLSRPIIQGRTKSLACNWLVWRPDHCRAAARFRCKIWYFSFAFSSISAFSLAAACRKPRRCIFLNIRLAFSALQLFFWQWVKLNTTAWQMHQRTLIKGECGGRWSTQPRISTSSSRASSLVSSFESIFVSYYSILGAVH